MSKVVQNILNCLKLYGYKPKIGQISIGPIDVDTAAAAATATAAVAVVNLK